MKNLKPILGISLLVQSLTFFVLALVNVERKKNLAKAFAVLSAVSGVAGGGLIYAEYNKRKKLIAEEDDFLDEFDEFLEDYDDIDVCEDEILCSFESEEDAE